MSTAAQRLSTLKNHVAGASLNQTGALCAKNGDDVVIVSAKRTAICKARRGAFKVLLLIYCPFFKVKKSLNLIQRCFD